MVCITHLVVSLFLLVSSPFGVSSGFSISSRESSKVSEQLLSQSLSATKSTTEHPSRENESTKAQKIVLNTADHQHPSSSSVASAAHHVPLDIASGSSRNSDSNINTATVVKREVSPTAEGEDGNKVNGLYDPGLMIMSKRSAAALNKLMWALRSIDEPTSSGSYETSVEGSNKETSGRFPKTGFRTSGSNVQFEPYTQTGLQRRGQKDRKVFLRCYFNAVSCFRRRK